MAEIQRGYSLKLVLRHHLKLLDVIIQQLRFKIRPPNIANL